MRSWWSLLAVVSVPFAGCLGGDAPPTEPAAPVTEADPWEGTDRAAVSFFDFEGAEADLPLCQNGGAQTTAPEFPRTGLVLPGSSHLEVVVTAEATMMGIQVGYRVGPGDGYTWLPVVFGGTETFTVPVTAEQWERPAVVGED